MATYSDLNSTILSDASRLLPFGLDGVEVANPLDPGNASVIGFIGHLAQTLLAGGNDPDRLAGGLGNDVLMGYGGDDSLHGGAGWNMILGGAGDDILDVRWLTDPDRGDLSHADWSAAKRMASDWLFGGSGNDSLFGSFGSDLLHGGSGNDMLSGQDGNDLLGVSYLVYKLGSALLL